jgi:hypothetical protein
MIVGVLRMPGLIERSRRNDMRAKLYKAMGGFVYICIMAFFIAIAGCEIGMGNRGFISGLIMGIAIWFLDYINERLSMTEHLNYTLRLDLEEERKKR